MTTSLASNISGAACLMTSMERCAVTAGVLGRQTWISTCRRSDQVKRGRPGLSYGPPVDDQPVGRDFNIRMEMVLRLTTLSG